MIDDREILRHLQEGGSELYDRPAPPRLDLDAITGGTASRVAPRRRRALVLRPVAALGCALAFAGAGLLGGALLFRDPGPAASPRASSPPVATQPRHVREVSMARFGNDAPPDAAAEVKVFAATGGRTVDLSVHGLPTPRKGDFYELWVLGDSGRMISLGIVRVDPTGSAEAQMPLPVSLRRFPVFDLSLEQGDGDPTHSGHSVLRSAATA